MKLAFRRRMAWAAAATLTLGAAVTAAPAVAANAGDTEFVLYITNWDDMETVKRLHTTGVANHVTTLNYAFGDVAPANLTREEASGHPDNGTTGMNWEDYDEAEHGPIVCKPTDPEIDFFREFSAAESVSGRAETGGLVQQVALLKQMHPQIKVLPSLGGATLSKWFSLASLTAESRATLIDSCVDLWINGDYSDEENGAAANFAGVFDGVDIDWEFPAYVDPETGEPQDRTGNGLSIDAGDAENYNLLAQEFRAALEEALTGPALVTAATPASPWTGDGYDFPGLAEHLDWFSVMAYDLHGTWEDEVGHGAGIADKEWGVGQSVEMYLNGNGIDPSKIVLGVPFYGPAWTEVEPTEEGEFYYEGEKWGAPAMLGVPGTPLRSFNWNEIAALVAASDALEIEWDEDYEAAYLYDSDEKTYYSFDDPRAIETKIQQLVNELDLRGVMAWEFDGDTADGELSGVIIDELALPFVPTDPLPPIEEEDEEDVDDEDPGEVDDGEGNGDGEEEEVEELPEDIDPDQTVDEDEGAAADDGDAAPTERLPETGSNSVPALIAAGILLIVGAAAVLITRSRRRGA